MWIPYIYGVLVVITGVAAIFKGATLAGITRLIGPALCWWGGCGMYGSFRHAKISSRNSVVSYP